VPKIGVAHPTSNPEVLVDADLDTLATALHVKADDLLTIAPWRPEVRIAPRIADAEVVQ
jgi:hypothetical protein